MNLPIDTEGAVAVITGGASGIGLAAAKHLAGRGLRICIVDLGAERLEKARAEILAAAPAAEVLAREVDVSDRDAVVALEREVTAQLGGADVLMNNAGIQVATSALGPVDAWRRLIEVNLWGIVHGTQVFVPGMIARGRPGIVINTGSKQGITTPPGNPAYNVSKAGVKAFTEALEHELRGMPERKVRAHLLIPGFVFTGLTARGRTEKPAGAWTAEETVEFMIARIEVGDFYILCPDEETPRALDERRILWAAGDIVENRPPLSRWHPEYGEAFQAFAAAGTVKKGSA
jgi:NAD(P)-dependent dehydrogenase (short-subunit alcohol dehydrogenase family)